MKKILVIGSLNMDHVTAKGAAKTKAAAPNASFDEVIRSAAAGSSVIPSLSDSISLCSV